MRITRNSLTAACALAAATFAFGGGVATAGSTDMRTTSIQDFNTDCGHAVKGSDTIGKATYLRLGNEVTATYDLKHGPPNTEFTVELWGAFCEQIGTLAHFTTNSEGKGSGGGTIEVPAEFNRFFVTGEYPEGHGGGYTWDNAVAVRLPATRV